MNNQKPDEKQTKDKKAKQKPWERLKDEVTSIKFWLEIMALIGLALYVFETHRTNVLTKENFAKDQRPYIWSSFLKTVPVEPNQRLAAHIFFANYGKTPAIKYGGMGKIFFGKDALAQADAWFDDIGKNPPQEWNSDTIIPPGLPPDPEKAPNYTTIYSDYAITESDRDYIRDNDFSAVIAQATNSFRASFSAFGFFFIPVALQEF